MSQPNVGENLALGIDVGTTSVKIAVVARIEGGGNVKVEFHAEKDTKVSVGVGKCNGISKTFLQ